MTSRPKDATAGVRSHRGANNPSMPPNILKDSFTVRPYPGWLAVGAGGGGGLGRLGRVGGIIGVDTREGGREVTLGLDAPTK